MDDNALKFTLKRRNKKDKRGAVWLCGWNDKKCITI